ncbi:hypothetical protein FTO74_18970 [Granulicella sp. WH15]|uniref:TonB-dependent receptor n=1 Tax=Granulicella sp. WH15 TaxID=2602070 RepID=UPI001366BB90|nr:TonB-dependent receptor [Granulicella sp. WH15]QHN05202.1 hypothetical protein FTO74_18970 [Granulicella sp. WH15]
MHHLRRPELFAANSSRCLRVLAALCLFYCCLIARAQGPVDSALRGVVADPFRGAVAGARVVVHNTDTQAERTAYTGSDGSFLVPHLPPGSYSVTAAAPGFSTGRQTELTLALGETAEVRMGLAVASSVTVTAEPEPEALVASLRPEDLSLLPINNRRWQSFAELTPGVEPDQDGDGLLSFHGLASTQNSLLIDGLDANQSFSSVPLGTGSDRAGSGSFGMHGLGRGRASGAPTSFSQQAVREFRVSGQGYSALTGHAGGGVITTVSKSGTSTLHGSGFLLIRSSALAATSPLSIATTYTDGVISSGLVKPQDLRQNFGGTLGGPVLPRHGLFYFYAYDQQRRDFPAISSPVYATFFALTPTQRALLANRGVSTAATNAALDYLSSLTGTVPRRADETINFGRIDWRFTRRNTLGIAYNRVRWTSPAGLESSPVVARGRASLGNSTGSLDQILPHLNTIFGAHLSNALRGQISHDLQFETPQPNLPQEPTVGPGGFAPGVNIGPQGFLFGTPASVSRMAYPDESRYQISDTLSYGRGRHLIQLGGDLSLVHDLVSTLANAAGTFSYDSSLVNGHAGGLVDWITDYTFNVHAYPNGACPSINAADHLFCFRSFTQSFGPQAVAFDTQEWAAFVEDQWRVGPRLHFNIGLRYEYELLPLPQLPNPTLDVIFSTRGATSIFPEDRNNLAPRVGLAWSPFGEGRGLIRLGYGIFYGRLPGTTIRSALANTAEPGATTKIRITPSTETDCPQVANQGFGYACSYLSAPPSAVAATTTATVFDRRFRIPMIQQGSLSLERSLGAGLVLSATYVMNLDRQLASSTDINIAPSTETSTFQLQGGGPPTGAQAGTQPGFTFQVPLYTERITPLFGPVTDITSNVNATYNAGVLALDRRTRGGLELRASYTWSKAIDYGQAAYGTPRTNAQFDPMTIRYDKGRSALSYPQSLHVAAVWQPVVHGRGVKRTAAGWSFAPILTAHSGRPYTLQIFGGSTLKGGRESINGSGGATYLPTVGRNTLRLPPVVNLDLRAAKTIAFAHPDRLRLRLSAEAFNLTNRLNLSSVSQRAYLVGTAVSGVTPLIFQDAATIASEGLNTQPFGAPTSASTSLNRERQIQLGLHLEF